MEKGNYTQVTQFFLLGFSDHPEDLQVILFLIFLVIYIMTVVGNLGIILLIKVESHLHTPMYFFLSHLSFIDICYSSSITPKLLMGTTSAIKSISLFACAVQMYLFIMFVVTESFLLAAMAYDRYVAICNPLLYTVIMSRNVCIFLVLSSYLWGIICALVHTISAFRLTFCGNVINHFFCDVVPVLILSCSDTQLNKTLLFIFATFVESSTIIIILMSYILIIVCVSRIHSSKGKYKAFSTCASHFTAISIFHVTILLIYCQPNVSHGKNSNRITSVFYTMVIPMLNPLIYSLRNKEVKGAFQKLVKKKHFCIILLNRFSHVLPG